jgi:glycosyltransferase involved in cell wall biosynthesis
MNPSIAVIVPVKNGRRFLEETFASIWAQNYAPLEVFVVDDASTDGTPEFVRSLRGRPLHLLEVRDAGPAAARNAAIHASHSDLIAFLDADDLWVPGALHLLVRTLTEQPHAGIAQGLIRNFRETQPGHKQFVTAAYRFLNLGSALWRRDVFNQVGLLDEDMMLCEDLDFLLRCWEQGIGKVEVESVVLHYRRHPGGMTHGLSGAGFGSVKAYKKRIERTRTGRFDPALPRHISLHRYLGTAPLNQDGHLHASIR